ncbi:MAG TPA: hypothetical protein VMJ75_30450 [Candidatus Acidoferrales bacterium]|nr:hypothetical protein [Candidatus Acidoferrales bacterium]
MAGELLSFSLAELITVALAAVLAILVALLGYRAYRRSRITPEERERRRRAWLVATGKMGDATLVEVRDTLLFYSYAVRGVEYTASQDIAVLGEKAPSGYSINGSVSVKYDARNPANSIVAAEEWSGLR